MRKKLQSILIAALVLTGTLYSQTQMDVVLDSFEKTDSLNVLFGGKWGKVTDGNAGTTINFEIKADAAANGSTKGLYVTGKFGGWGAAIEVPLKLDRSPRYLPFDGVSFYAKAVNGSTTKIRLRVREKKADVSRGYNYAKYDFIPTAEWKLYTVTWDSLTYMWADASTATYPFSTSDIFALDFGPAVKNAVADVYVDDLKFFKNVKGTDSLLVEGFETKDSTNLVWGGKWSFGADNNANTTLTYKMVDSASSPAAGSTLGLHLSGKIGAWATVQLSLAKGAPGLNIPFQGLSFWAKANGSQNKVRVRVREKKSDASFNYRKFDFIPTNEWKLYSVDFDSLGLLWADPAAPKFTGTDVYTIDFCPAATNSVINVFVDNISLWNKPEDPLPVELTSLTAQANENSVRLSWSTATETNSYGFEVEKSVNGKDYVKAGFIKSNGNSVSRQDYSFSETTAAGSYTYRLKMVDLDGTFSHSKVVNVTVGAPKKFALGQNYPNPFNPSTTISFTVPADGMVNLSVFNMLGEKVAELVNEIRTAGFHTVQFDASELSSGTYIYRLSSDLNTQVMKMMLIK